MSLALLGLLRSLTFILTFVRTIAFVAPVFFVNVSWAQESMRSGSSGQIRSAKRWPIESRVGFEAESFVQSEPSQGVATEDARVNFQAQSGTERRSGFQYAAEAVGSVSLDARGRENRFLVPQAYVGWHQPHRGDWSTGFYLGRKLETWSEVDSLWALGLWQPLDRFDGIRVSEQGLTGAFFEHGEPEARILLFASSVFLPETGPAFELREGRFRSRNPWFVAPVDRLILLENEKPIYYEVEWPDLNSLVDRPSFGGVLTLGRAQGFSARLAYARKPRNQFALPFDAYTDLKSALVRIHPKVVYHHLSALDLSYRGPWWRVFAGAAQESPDRDMQLAEGLTGQVLGPLTVASFGLDLSLLRDRWWGPKLRLAWLDTVEDRQKMEGPLMSDQSPFGPRLMWTRAASLDIRARIYRGHGWVADQGIKIVEEFVERGRVWVFDFALSANTDWSLRAYADVLQSAQDIDANPGFISRFRGNDRVGLSYSILF